MIKVTGVLSKLPIGVPINDIKLVEEIVRSFPTDDESYDSGYPETFTRITLKSQKFDKLIKVIDCVEYVETICANIKSAKKQILCIPK